MTDIDHWEVFSENLSQLKAGSSDLLSCFKEAESLAESSGVYITQTIVDAITATGRDDLILASGKQSHAGYRAELNEAIFTPLIGLFPAVDLEYWYVCVVSAAKQVGITEPDTSNCMSECFRAQSWPYDMQFAVLLTQIYQLQEPSSEVGELNTQSQEVLKGKPEGEVKPESKSESNNKESQPVHDEVEKGYVLYAFGANLSVRTGTK
jgi:hypothetical protein